MGRSLFTTDTDVRLKFFGSMMALLVLSGYYGLILLTVLGYGTLNRLGTYQFAVLALIVLAAGTWTFGIDLIDAYLGHTGGDDGD